jgi:hypothetical protein
MRAAHIKENLAAVHDLPADQAAAVLAACGPELVRSIEDAARVAWLPVEVDVALTLAVHQATGDAGVRRWSRQTLLKTSQQPLLRTVVEAGVRIFGMTPRGLYRWVPHGWGTIYREGGELTFEARAGDSAVLIHHDIPAPMRSLPYLVGMAGAFEAVLDLAQADGEVELEYVEPSNRALYEIRWRPRAA